MTRKLDQPESIAAVVLELVALIFFSSYLRLTKVCVVSSKTTMENQ